MSIIGIFRLQVDGMLIKNITNINNKQVEMWLKGWILYSNSWRLIFTVLSLSQTF